MTAAPKKITKHQEDEEEEQVEPDTSGQRGEASKDMKNINQDDSNETDVTTNAKKAVAVKSNEILEALQSFKEDVVKSRVRAALKKRELDKIVVAPEDVELIVKELHLTPPQATQYLKKFNGDARAALTHFITSPPCTINNLLS